MKKLKLPNGLECYCLSQQETEFIFAEIFIDREYIQNGIVIHPGDCIFDVGANIGLFSLFINGFQDNLKIFAFEPIAATFSVLRSNINLHNITNISLFNYGLGSENDPERLFTFYPHMPGNSTERPDEKISQKDIAIDLFGEEKTEYLLQSAQVISEIRTLSRVIADLSINSIDLLKIDVEGGEIDVIQGIKSDDWIKIKQIVAEVHDTGHRLTQFCSILKERGFQVTVAKSPLLPSALNNYDVYAVRL
ncbi:MAG: FkbM family methyltransferase [Cyanobacteria bacterium SBLK]|nr:FkbM family methyltransferase [Cyanobacteria bacterium SBLK]